MSRIGFVGAGQMGGPMVDRLLQAGFTVDLFARREEVARTFAALGANVAGSLGAVAAGADVIVVCVYDQTQLSDVTLGEDRLLAGARPGSVLANHSTVGMQLIR